MLKLMTEKYEEMFVGDSGWGGGSSLGHTSLEKQVKSKPKLYKFKDGWYAKGPLGETFGMTPKTALDKYLDLNNLKQATANKTSSSDSSWSTPSQSSYDSGYDVATQTAVLASCSMF